MHRQDVKRPELLLQDATSQANKAALDFNRAQADVSEGRSQFFEKLAIGSGAAITAIISFLGSHAGSTLRPEWILRCSLVSLVVALLTALGRNFLYPFYIIAFRHLLCAKASRNKLQYSDLWFDSNSVAGNATVDMDSGEPLDPTQWKATFAETDQQLQGSTVTLSRRAARFEHAWLWAESLCLVSVCTAMVSLACLALLNF